MEQMDMEQISKEQIDITLDDVEFRDISDLKWDDERQMFSFRVDTDTVMTVPYRRILSIDRRKIIEEEQESDDSEKPQAPVECKRNKTHLSFILMGAASVIAGIGMVVAGFVVSDIHIILVAVFVLGGLNLMKG